MTNQWTEEVERLNAEVLEWKSLCFAQGMKLKGLEIENKELLEALKKAVDRPLEVRAIMESNGIIFDNVFQDKWQQVAFTLYTIIVETAMESKNLIEKVGAK